MPSKILITGASGFVGRAFALYAMAHNSPLRVVVRRTSNVIDPMLETVQVSDIDADTNWSAALEGINVVIHCAARAHVLKERSRDPLTEYRLINVLGTINLARQAVSAGVRRFLFLSSIGVNGPETHGKAFTAEDIAAPTTPYAISKCEAERELQALSKRTGLEVVVIRAPLIYGPGAKGNLEAMIRWIDSGIPLPLGAIHNKRSLVGLDNLVDLLFLCLSHPQAANQIFLVSDGQDLSTTEFLRGIADALGKRARLIPIPSGLLRTVAGLTGASDIAQKLIGSLQIDTSKTRRLLGWSPPINVGEGLKRIARAHDSRHSAECGS